MGEELYELFMVCAYLCPFGFDVLIIDIGILALTRLMVSVLEVSTKDVVN